MERDAHQRLRAGRLFRAASAGLIVIVLGCAGGSTPIPRVTSAPTVSSPASSDAAWSHFSGGGVSFDYPTGWTVVRQSSGLYSATEAVVIAHDTSSTPARGVIAVEIVGLPDGTTGGEIASFLDLLVKDAPSVRSETAGRFESSVVKGPSDARLAGRSGKSAVIRQNPGGVVAHKWAISAFGFAYVAHCQWDSTFSEHERALETEACSTLQRTLAIDGPPGEMSPA